MKSTYSHLYIYLSPLFGPFSWTHKNLYVGNLLQIKDFQTCDGPNKQKEWFVSFILSCIYIVVCNLILDKLTIQHREENVDVSKKEEENVEMYILKFMYT